jgi:hypothetical protein
LVWLSFTLFSFCASLDELIVCNALSILVLFEVNNRSNSQNNRPATNDFDVNCPTYEIEYFPSLEDNSSLDNAFQTINSSSDAQKLNKVKESQTNLLQSSPKTKLTEFEKAYLLQTEFYE